MPGPDNKDKNKKPSSDAKTIAYSGVKPNPKLLRLSTQQQRQNEAEDERAMQNWRNPKKKGKEHKGEFISNPALKALLPQTPTPAPIEEQKPTSQRRKSSITPAKADSKSPLPDPKAFKIISQADNDIQDILMKITKDYIKGIKAKKSEHMAFEDAIKKSGGMDKINGKLTSIRKKIEPYKNHTDAKVLEARLSYFLDSKGNQAPGLNLKNKIMDTAESLMHLASKKLK